MMFSRKVLAHAAVCALMVAGASAQAQSAEPKPGGSLSIATVFRPVTPMTFDPYDWNWKFNHDYGGMYESLLVGDLDQAKGRGGKHAFTVDAYLPNDAIKGELAESWQMLDNPRRIEFKLRKGVMFPEKKGVMAARELTAEDVVFTFNHMNKSPKKIAGYFDHIETMEAKDPHTVVMTFKKYFAEWDYRFGWGYHSAIFPKEVVEAGAANWRKANGTGPFMLANYVQGNTLTYAKNKDYWGSTTIGGKSYKLPFVDTVNYRIIKDEATALTALRTGKLDIMEAVPWTAVAELKKSAPQLKWNRYLSSSSATITLRTDTKPFDDLRVRQALNMAVDREQLLKTYYGGNAEALSFPMHMDYGDYYEPLKDMPQGIKDLFSHKPEEAKKLLAAAGLPNGFEFTVQTSSAAPNNELLSLLASQFAKVGVTMKIQVLEFPAYMSLISTKKHGEAFFLNLGPTNPTSTIRKTFLKGQPWNGSMVDDPKLDAQVQAMLAEPDEAKRKTMLRGMTREVLGSALHIWLPSPYHYTAWWPWVQNYHGELRAGADRPGPIHARIWVDQAMKKKLGF